MEKKPVLWIIIPCYNEEEVLPITSPQFKGKILSLIEKGKIAENSRVLFVNDGSKDRTWDLICSLAKEDEHYIGISQSRNRGHQNAVLAGLMEAKDTADITISIDCDGQDDINAMDEMVDAYLEGCEVVYGVRSARETDTWFKRTTAEGFYKVMNAMGAEVVFNHADYRLVSSRVLQHFSDFKEVNLFLRGLIPLIGFKSGTVYYERRERLAGKTHYPLKKMLGLAWDGITSLSIKPIHMIVTLGLGLLCVGLAGLIVFLIAGKAVWSLAFLMILLSGIQVCTIGVVGEYVGKNYMESKHRPRYIISERTFVKEENN